MKKIIAILLICLAANTTIKAQYVNIPDTAFRNYLITQYPTCFNAAKQMDTTCSGVVNAKALSIGYKIIYNLSGIRYFKSLQKLYCDGNYFNSIDSLPATLKDLSCGSLPNLTLINGLPNGLRGLFMSDNPLITSLPSLPSTIDSLNFSDCSVAVCPALPNTMRYLCCYRTKLTNFTGLPDSLKTLICWQNTLTSLPAIPSTLKFINCQQNLLTSLPLLPNTLMSLYCSDNKLTSLPNFPNALYEIYCFNNLITSISGINSSLQYLYCYNNKITSISQLPSTLIELKCSNNLLTALPDLPFSLNFLSCVNNSGLHCLPYLPKPNIQVYFDTANIKCLPDSSIYLLGTIGVSTYPICNISNNPNNCQIFGASPNYVNIPDTSFGSFLLAKYPSCLYKDANNKYWMDTTCSGVVNADSILYNGFPLADSQKIQNLQGVQYFTNLKYLDVTKNLLSSIPTLPKTLQYLNTNFNSNIVSLPALPNALISLNCYQNALTSLPQLPNNLQTLDVLGNNLSVLPTLPNSLLYLRTYGNPLLTCLPLLPSNITDLYTDVPCIPNKPVTLVNAGNTPPPPICNATNNPNNCTVYLPNYVNIPDTSFGNFLLAKYPSCLYKDASNLYWMDTTCSDVVSETIGFSLTGNIENIYGIQYFKNINSLFCSNTDIKFLARLPQKIKYLSLYNSPIKQIENLSDSLTQFIVKLCQLDSLPNLPDGLIKLTCPQNFLKKLPKLPSNLVYLSCAYNNIGTLPNLPNGLQNLECHYNNITSLPKLPDSLRILYCDHNYITQLPILPNRIGVVDCNNNLITCLPKLPPSLIHILVDSVIKCVPNVSPNTEIWVIGQPQTNSLPICSPVNNVNQCHIYPIVNGKVFTDNNSNNAKDANEFYRPFVKLSLDGGQQFTYSNLTGSYSISVDSFGSYTLKVTPPPYFKAVPDSINISFTAGSTSLILPDIALQPIAAKDSFGIIITKLNRPRPGFGLAYNISYANMGTISSVNDNIIPINYDTSKLHFDSATVATTTNGIYNAPLEVNAGKLVAGQGGSFNIYFTVKPTVAIGDTIRTMADLIYSSTKIYDVDNAIVVGSFDPNDKQATPTLTPQQVSNGEYIDYVIRFQNTGNANATNIVISDTLSNLLQFINIQIVSSSHNSNISYSVGNGVIYFQFLNINLPYASANEPLSHGFVRFRVKALPTLAIGTIVPNTANIYFDYNTPIVTNTATTQVKAIIVPVRIISYTITANNNREIRNDWRVGAEINTSHYIIQRSMDGKDFLSVGEVAARGLNSYSFTDKVSNDILQHTVYYRLKIFDKDGMFTYSDVKQITRNEKQETISMYPNPARDMVNIDCSDASNLLIMDALGKTIIQYNNITKHQTINTKQFTKGVYMVKLIMNNGTIRTSKLIIE